MAILRDCNGVFYEIPDQVLKKYAVPPRKVKQILKKVSVGQGEVGPGFGIGLRPSTIIINLGPPYEDPGTEESESGQVRAHSSGICWRRSCGCWRRSCSCKK